MTGDKGNGERWLNIAGRVGTTAKIAAAHICEDKQYYRKLKRYIEK